MCLFRPGDIVKWKPIDRDDYDATVADVEAGKFAPLIRDVTFSLDEFNKDIDGYNRKLDGGAPWPLRSSRPGLATTVQDLGRPGYYHLGIPLSGGMDRFALRAANLLVGNDEGAAVLEAVFMGPELEFTADATVAVTGAELPPKVDGEPRETWTSFTRQEGPGAVLRLPEEGRARLYRGLGRHRRAGGARQPLDLSARRARRLQGPQARRPATSCRSARPRRGQGGPHGCRQRCAACPASRPSCACCPASTGTASPRRRASNFFDDTWKVAPEADRIGYRFRGGRPLEFVPRKQPFGAGSDPSNIVDACYPYGSIQVPGGTEPIVLHRDAVSGGGYFMVGTVISADMDLIGQLQPHTETRFVEVDMPAALKARHDRAAMLDKIRQSLA